MSDGGSAHLTYRDEIYKVSKVCVCVCEGFDVMLNVMLNTIQKETLANLKTQPWKPF